MASTTFDLPQPLGPTTPVTPLLKIISVRFANDLKPHIASFLSCIFPSPPGGPGGRALSLLPRDTTTWTIINYKVSMGKKKTSVFLTFGQLRPGLQPVPDHQVVLVPARSHRRPHRADLLGGVGA